MLSNFDTQLKPLLKLLSCNHWSAKHYIPANVAMDERIINLELSETVGWLAAEFKQVFSFVLKSSIFTSNCWCLPAIAEAFKMMKPNC
ncbi:hypothetical protein H5410_064149 [Solanum commersonii]|uniref:Uncharacterized protein n=1 Tax=Solanum commersonii TaxID=4109 RepID=A0A9J5W0B1_SOLCO|nr:hypothetical protein H5410_064149 [Solanum commersonii]